MTRKTSWEHCAICRSRRTWRKTIVTAGAPSMDARRAIRAIRSARPNVSGRETVRLDEVGRSVAQGEVARPGKAVVVVPLYRSGVQHLADSLYSIGPTGKGSL